MWVKKSALQIQKQSVQYKDLEGRLKTGTENKDKTRYFRQVSEKCGRVQLGFHPQVKPIVCAFFPCSLITSHTSKKLYV